MESGQFRVMKGTLDDNVRVTVFNQQTWESTTKNTMCMCVFVGAFVRALSFISVDNAMWSMHTRTKHPCKGDTSTCRKQADSV